MKLDPMACKKANIGSREDTLRSLKRYRVTPGRVAKRLSEALDAKEVKVFNDKDAGIVYSEPLVAHQIRIKAIEISSVLLEMRPSEKHDVSLNQPIVVEVVKFAEDSHPQ